MEERLAVLASAEKVKEAVHTSVFELQLPSMHWEHAR